MEDKNLEKTVDNDWERALIEDEQKEVEKGNVNRTLIKMRADSCNAFMSDIRSIKMYYLIAYKNRERSKLAEENNDVDSLKNYYDNAKSALDKTKSMVKGLSKKANLALENTKKIKTNNSIYVEKKINKLMSIVEEYYFDTETLTCKIKDSLDRVLSMQDSLQQQ